MKIRLVSVSIDDYEKALRFYTEVLGFIKKRDVRLGHGARFLTVVSPEDPEGPELILEPNGRYPAMKALKRALVKDHIPFIAFQVDDVEHEYERLRNLGVKFTLKPTETSSTIEAVFRDTCGNLVQIYQEKTSSAGHTKG